MPGELRSRKARVRFTGQGYCARLLSLCEGSLATPRPAGFAGGGELPFVLGQDRLAAAFDLLLRRDIADAAGQAFVAAIRHAFGQDRPGVVDVEGHARTGAVALLGGAPLPRIAAGQDIA